MTEGLSVIKTFLSLYSTPGGLLGAGTGRTTATEIAQGEFASILWRESCAFLNVLDLVHLMK